MSRRRAGVKAYKNEKGTKIEMTEKLYIYVAGQTSKEKEEKDAIKGLYPFMKR
jgi:hypothetical protein